MSGWENVRVILLHISPKFTLFWGRKGAKTGVKLGKNVPYPDKSHYKWYILAICEMSGWEDVRVTLLHISPKFTLFWGCKGPKSVVCSDV